MFWWSSDTSCKYIALKSCIRVFSGLKMQSWNVFSLLIKCSIEKLLWISNALIGWACPFNAVTCIYWQRLITHFSASWMTAAIWALLTQAWDFLELSVQHRDSDEGLHIPDDGWWWADLINGRICRIYSYFGSFLAPV